MSGSMTSDEAFEFLAALSPQLLLEDVSFNSEYYDLLADRFAAAPLAGMVHIIVTRGSRSVELALRTMQVGSEVLSSVALTA